MGFAILASRAGRSAQSGGSWERTRALPAPLRIETGCKLPPPTRTTPVSCPVSRALRTVQSCPLSPPPLPTSLPVTSPGPPARPARPQPPHQPLRPLPPARGSPASHRRLERGVGRERAGRVLGFHLCSCRSPQSSSGGSDGNLRFKKIWIVMTVFATRGIIGIEILSDTDSV